jgi:GH24 family phage-related lysozyme (muramidase)
MKVSAAGRKAIAAHEGVRLKAYPDPATDGEPWTIGVGHTSAAGPPRVYKGMTITADECDEILSRDLATFERAVEKAVTVPLNQNQFDALVSFTFNVGAGNLQKSTLLRKLNARNYRGAADQFAAWNKAAGKVMAGLTRRRAEERELFLKPPAPVMTTISSPGIEVERLPKAPYPTPLDKPQPASASMTHTLSVGELPDQTHGVATEPAPPRRTLLQRLSSIFRN